MNKTWFNKIVIGMVLMGFFAACDSSSPGSFGTRSDGGTESQTDDVNVGGDSDTDTDSDADSDSDTDVDTDTDSDSDTDTDTDTDSDSDGDADGDSDGDADGDSDGDSDSDTDSDSDPGNCTGTDTSGCPDDGNPCTGAACDNGACKTVNLPSTTPCSFDDGLYCTTADHCDGSGTCVAGSTSPCDIDEICNEDDNTCCLAQYEKQCFDGDIFWYDGCGRRGNYPTESCPEDDAGVPLGECIDANCWCEGDYVLELPPLDIYFMLDRSGSMAGSNITALKAGVTDFCQDSESEGTWVTGQDFHGDSCTVSDYSTPAKPWGQITSDGAVPPNYDYATFTTWISNMSTGGGTPTQPALEGAIQACKNRIASVSGHKCVVVFVTDGEPFNCTDGLVDDSDNWTSANWTTAYDLFGGIADDSCTDGIPVFTVGFPGLSTEGLALINRIGQDGCTGNAVIISGSSMGSDFTDALKDIQKESVDCEFDMPTFPTDVIDIDQAKVVFTPSTGGGAQEFTKVADISGCSGGAGEYFYYDDNANPTKIYFCDNLCDKVLDDTQGDVTITVDCANYQ